MMVTSTLGIFWSGPLQPWIGAGASSLWIQRWLSSTSSVLLVAPVLMAVSRQSFAQVAEHWVKGGLWMLAVAFCCVEILLVTPAIARPLLVVSTTLVIVYGAIRFGLVIASSASFAIASLAAFSFEFGMGAFGQTSKLEGLITIWSFSAALSGLSMTVTALLAERDREGLERGRAERLYRELFNGSPQPIWVHDQDSGKFLLVNKATERQYGWAGQELLSSTIELLAPPEGLHTPPVSQPEPLGVGLVEGNEARHRTKDGRLLNVEVWSRTIDFGSRPAELVFALDVTERRALSRALIEAIVGEQRRIGQDMHDGLGQELTGLCLFARASATRERHRDAAVAHDFDYLATLASSCLRGATKIIQGLSPLTDAEGDLDNALATLAERSSSSGTLVSFESDHGTNLHINHTALNHLYRIAQEAVQNALKHSGAQRIAIALTADSRTIRLSISDDGQGILTDNSKRRGMGLRTMQFRSNSIGSRLSILRRELGGTEVVCEVPFEVTGGCGNPQARTE